MCGAISKGPRIIRIISNDYMPRDIIRHFYSHIIPTKDLKISDHRFIRRESIYWWSNRVQLYKYYLKADRFYEKGHPFDIPSRYVIAALVYITTEPFISIVTVPANQQVSKFHDRMPLVIRRPA